MKILSTKFLGVKIIQSKIYKDNKVHDGLASEKDKKLKEFLKKGGK